MVQDHPHACGDKRLLNAFEHQFIGSSPRVWGQGIRIYESMFTSRIIPTRVGTSRATVTVREKERDHPHACGDKLMLGAGSAQKMGSSPRVWGQVSVLFDSQFFSRIIPTRVGTSDKVSFYYLFLWDHPHACGDKRSMDFVGEGFIGSSPRVWGQEVCLIIESRGIRIIPTRVGTSTPENYRGFVVEDHPHACGDKTVYFGIVYTSLGSSPRVWGQGFKFGYLT